MAMQFFGFQPYELSQRLEVLMVDLRRMSDGVHPLGSELGRAPILDHWSVGMAAIPVAFGERWDRYGRPMQRVQTSPLFAADLSRGWVRTLSRYYVLGRTEEERGITHD